MLRLHSSTQYSMFLQIPREQAITLQQNVTWKCNTKKKILSYTININQAFKYRLVPQQVFFYEAEDEERLQMLQINYTF